ncbi:MAG: hypothetical protein CYPHOPRED_005466 [Cyphobasidiales sp. Tagirdzhanova-0007]|nr:MAG: hypothetical protein CYPHOPRED_005466 [Cyphobasidiales sp. Tagirdzhanova-0007]
MSDEPVLLVEIKPPGHINAISSRCLADDQMRDRFIALTDLVTRPYLYGFSVLGTRFGVYRLTIVTGEIEPAHLSRSRSRVVYAAPQSQWNFDVTTADGFAKWMEVVTEVKHMTL